MPLMNWGDQYSVGIDLLDEEHRTLFQMVNELYNSLNTATEQAVIRKQLLSLAEYARKHFSEEEQLMERAKFPGLAEHRIEHEDLTTALLSLKLARAKEGKINALHLANFLHEWFARHI